MFSRQLLCKLAYDSELPGDFKLPDLPGPMNDPDIELKFGFQAAFQSACPRFSEQVVHDFFPWAKVAPWTGVDGLGLFFDQVIRSEPMGPSCDDICTCWEPKGDEQAYRYRFGH
jgi:hypothetical protein